MVKNRTREVVAYESPAELIIGPVSSEVILIENCFARAAKKRKLKDFERKVYEVSGSEGMVEKVKEILAKDKEVENV